MRTYIIAEVGPNHNGSVDVALKMIEGLSKTGVDAVKFQLCNPEDVYSLDAFMPSYQRQNETSTSPLEMSKKYQLSQGDHVALYRACRDKKLDYVCTAFDLESLMFLDQNMDLPFFKVASGEIFSLDMLDYISDQKKPVVMSCGMATYSEIELAIRILNRKSKKDITLLHCVSSYPTRYTNVNLRVIAEMINRYACSIGYSDHTIGNECALAAVAMGAVMIEKHVTLDRELSGPDHKASSTIEEYGELVTSIRNIEMAMGGKEKKFSDDEIEIKKAARKSIVSTRDISSGEMISEEHLCYKRPGIGFLPVEKDTIIGKRAKADIAGNTVISKEQIE